jgi:inositol 1,4,5-triphosphate receptor type 1
MTIEYFVTELPNFVFMTPNNHNMLYDVTSNFSFLHKCFPSDPPPRRSLCFDIYFLSYKPVGYIIFLTCSGLSLLTYGYFYSFCLILILARFNVIQQVIEAVAGKVWQIVFVVLLMMSIMFAYAVLSYTFLSTFFNAQSNLFCSTLWQCFITVMREGILDTFGNRIPVTAVNQIHPDFGIYVWRAIIDLSFYVVINIIGLNIITAILVDRFSELRAKKDAAYNDQKSVCFICGIPNDTFEKEGVKGKGFRDHYKNDHNVYSYIYYVLYIKSKSTQDHNAIEKYVYDMVNKKSVKFYPLHKAKALGY